MILTRTRPLAHSTQKQKMGGGVPLTQTTLTVRMTVVGKAAIIVIPESKFYARTRVSLVKMVTYTAVSAAKNAWRKNSGKKKDSERSRFRRKGFATGIIAPQG